MKKSFIFASVFVGILMVSLVSAGWWSDLFNRPPSITGNVIDTRGMDLDLRKLSEGVQLSKHWNYWFIWKDSEMPVSQLVSGLDTNSYRYVYEYNPQTRKRGYWYGDSNSRNQFDKFVNGNYYAIYMLSSANWQYSSCKDSDGGKNYYQKGTVEGVGSGSYDDYCQYNNVLIERYCNSENPNQFTEEYNCASEGKVCQNGACVNPSDANETEETEIPKNLLPIKDCMAHSFSWSASVDGDHVCWEQTRNYCLISKVTMVVFNETSQEAVGPGFSDYMSCEDNFADFDEDDEINNANTNFQVICCSPN
tara:strand:- start:785 stop:1705 length:921 start_codon:yes stop_codon:yes gene_type:complete